MSNMIEEQEQARLLQEQRLLQLQAFDQREIPVTEEDVFRVGGTFNTERTSSIHTAEGILTASCDNTT